MIIFSQNGDLHGEFSLLPNESYLDESKWTIAELPEGESFDLDYEYSCVDGVAIKGRLSSENIEENARMKAEFDATQYQRDRAIAYPSYANQFDTIYHQGIDAWKADIKKVKDAHPKPSE